MKNISIFMAFGVVLIAGCTPPPQDPVQPEVISTTEKVPGALDFIWEEPMVDVVDVPPGLDPEGTYYRPGHQETVEIRQGKWKYYRPKE